jgi:hypothetical protein
MEEEYDPSDEEHGDDRDRYGTRDRDALVLGALAQSIHRSYYNHEISF